MFELWDGEPKEFNFRDSLAERKYLRQKAIRNNEKKENHFFLYVWRSFE